MKGLQGEKAVTDVGAGAGSQSRAADAHIVLREHEMAEHVVLERVVRSFKPGDPLALKWQFPVWTLAEGVDTAAVRGRLNRAEQKRVDQDRDAMQAVREGDGH